MGSRLRLLCLCSRARRRLMGRRASCSWRGRVWILMDVRVEEKIEEKNKAHGKKDRWVNVEDVKV